jgi:hypothetical protein
VIYTQEVKLSAFDSSLAIKNLHNGLKDRLQSYPSRKQVLIHLFDNFTSPDYLLQDRGRNEASFTGDARGFKPRKQQINKSYPITHTLSTPLPVTELKTLLASHPFEVLDHEKLYVDNYIFYSSLTRGVSSGVLPLLVYIPSTLSDLNSGLEFIFSLCQSIRTVLINNSY